MRVARHDDDDDDDIYSVCVCVTSLDWKSREKLISDVLQWTPTNGREKAVRPARTYIQHL